MWFPIGGIDAGTNDIHHMVPMIRIRATSERKYEHFVTKRQNIKEKSKDCLIVNTYSDNLIKCALLFVLEETAKFVVDSII